MSFQFPLRIIKTPICIPKTTAAVDREAANFSMLWFCLVRAAPVPEVFVLVAADAVDDMFATVGALCQRYLQYRLCAVCGCGWNIQRAPLALSVRP